MSIAKEIVVSSVIENLDEGGIPYGDAERTETRTLCETDTNNGITVIVYSEKTESGEVTTSITLADSCVRVKRAGEVVSDFLFSEGERHKSLYSVSGYSFDCEIFTRRIRRQSTGAQTKIDIHYDMTIGGADKRVRMQILI
jgi:uncharacterized beta-barrel protein YwiB (DUF1934 family)